MLCADDQQPWPSCRNPNVHTRKRPRVENPPAVNDASEEQMRPALGALLAAARTGDLPPADFAARLESLHTRFLGEKAHTPDMIDRRRSASAAYDHLRLAKDLEIHHHLELLAGHSASTCQPRPNQSGPRSGGSCAPWETGAVDAAGAGCTTCHWLATVQIVPARPSRAVSCAEVR